MTAPEPLTLTLEEARVLLSKNGKCLRFMVETIRSGSRLISSDWAEAVTAALDLPEPVVARDDATELRAALDVARDAMVDVLVFHHHVLSGPVKAQLNTAINTANAALAASEEES